MIHFKIFCPLNQIMLLTIFHLGKTIEQLSMSTFLSPFHWTVWLYLLILSIVISTALWISHSFSKNWKERNYIEAFCIVCSSIFGMGIWNANETNSKTSERLMLLVIFISGSLFYYTYCAFLTSSLAVPNEILPFDSPEGILNTKYR
jgi:hypothetical protein